jgi:NADP-dependent 3-hydroxy acid dehydrogenase YdfG
MISTQKVWFITGCSSGFGRALAEAVLKKGEKVVATARNLETIEDLQAQYPHLALALKLDVIKPEEVRSTVSKAIETFGSIDVLVNNAGYVTFGAIEEQSDAAIREQYEVHVFALLDVTRAVFPHMRHQRRGHIFNLSSLGGFVGVPGIGIYSGTKFAVEGLSEALAGEVAHLGIKVTIVEPGVFNTDLRKNAVLSNTMIEDYEASIGDFRRWISDVNGKLPGDPVKAAAAIIIAANSEKPPLRLVLGADAIEAIEAKLESVKTELQAWKEVGINTAYDGFTVDPIPLSTGLTQSPQSPP